MSTQDYSPNYLLYNAQVTKFPVIAIRIDGLSTILSSSDIFKRVSYGDPDIEYGTPGLIYGGLTPYGDFRTILDMSGSSLTLSQRLEPEQGRGAISTISLSFIDKDQFMSRLIAPGVVLDEILGKKITIFYGYQQLSFPQDFTVMFRGRVSAYDSVSGRVTLQISDPNMARRQQIFFTPKTKLFNNISASATTIPVISTADFYQQIIGPNGTYDPGVNTYITISDEVIEYAPSGFSATGFSGVVRGARGTTPDVHSADDEVSSAIQILDHGIDMALKLMLSGWNGPYLEDIAIRNFVTTQDPSLGDISGAILLPDNVDASRDYGLTPGDYLAITGSAFPGNNAPSAIIIELLNANGQPNNVILTDQIFATELASSATMDLRSQYDTYPVEAGVKLPADEVDVARHQNIQETFLPSDENRLRIYIKDTESSCKTFVESQIYLPLASYSLTRFGRLSMQLTHPPFADERLQFLTGRNVLNPQQVKPQRGVNNRKFFNEVDYDWDYNDAGDSTSRIKQIDTNSLSIIGISSVLPIQAKGVRTDLGSASAIQRRINFLLSRYKNGAVLIDLQTNWEVGSLIEAGDVVAIKDDGILQISNFATGRRNLGTQLFEVINRQMDMGKGTINLTVVSGLGADVTDRFASISPSSVIQTGSSTTAVIIADSYGPKYPNQEYRKWVDYFGLRVLIHTEDYSVAATAIIVRQSATNPFKLEVSGLSISPSAGMVMDIDNYPDNTDKLDLQAYKQIHAFFDPQVVATSGISNFSFVVAASGTSRFQLNLPIIVHTDDWSVKSPEAFVTDIDSLNNIITVDTDLGFTPPSGYRVDLIGFADGGGAYRYI